MKTLNKRLSVEEFQKYVNEFNFGALNPNKLVIHHTWKPTKNDWKGESTLNGIKNYYEGKAWNAGPHLFIAEDGIWLFSPMNKKGIHSGVGNYRSIGIEVVGDYDVHKWSGKTKSNAISAIKILMTRLKINTEMIKFHNDFSSKSCPGHAITKEWLFNEINFFNEEYKPPTWANDGVKFIKDNPVNKKPIMQIKNEQDARLATILQRFYSLIKKK